MKTINALRQLHLTNFVLITVTWSGKEKKKWGWVMDQETAKKICSLHFSGCKEEPKWEK